MSNICFSHMLHISYVKRVKVYMYEVHIYTSCIPHLFMSLLAICTRYKCRMETSRNKVMASKTVIRSSSVTTSQLGEMSDQSITYTACSCQSVLVVNQNHIWYSYLHLVIQY